MSNTELLREILNELREVKKILLGQGNTLLYHDSKTISLSTEEEKEIKAKEWTTNSRPFSTFTIINDGPGAIILTVNKRGLSEDNAEIRQGEAFVHDNPKNVVEKIYIKALASTTIRIFYTWTA